MSVTRDKFRTISGGTLDIIAPIPWMSAWWEHLRAVTGFFWWKSTTTTTTRAKVFDDGERRHDVLSYDKGN
jgi:hypothetical protein